MNKAYAEFLKKKAKMQNNVVSNIKEYLDKKGYRADLCVVSKRKPTSGKIFPIEVKYNASFGYPDEEDLLSLVNEHFANYEIDWSMIEDDPKNGVMYLYLEPEKEIIPIENIKAIPPEFKAEGTGIFSRKADASGNVLEIWELQKDDNGYALYRRHDDTEVLACDDEFKAGDIVDTPDGLGKLIKFDEVGNAIVQVGSLRRLVAAEDVKPYSSNKEKQRLYEYYLEAYGSPEYAKELVEQYPQ